MIWAALTGAFFTLALAGFACFYAACARKDRVFTPVGAPDTCKGRYVAACIEAYEQLRVQPHEDWRLTSFDGKKLRAELYPNGQQKNFLVMVHGYHASPVYDFGCIASFYYRLGYGLLLVTQRAHRESEGCFITYGAKESRDCRDFCRALSKRFSGCRIILHGISMGGATVMLAGGLGLPENVKGIIDDCGYTTPLEELVYAVKNRWRLPAAGAYAAALYARLLLGVSLRRASVPAAAAANPLPKLFIHGTEDDLVPYEMGRRNFEAAAGEKHFLSVPGAGHALSHAADPDRVENALKTFAANILDS